MKTTNEDRKVWRDRAIYRDEEGGAVKAVTNFECLDLLDDIDSLESQVARLKELLGRSAKFMKRMGHPYDGRCNTDHYTDVECNCDYDALISDYEGEVGK